MKRLNIILFITFFFIANHSYSEKEYIQTEYNQVFYDKEVKITQRDIRLEKGDNIVLSSRVFFRPKERVKDGGKSYNLYIKFKDPRFWDNENEYDLFDSVLNAIYFEIYEPGWPIIYKQDQVKGKVTVLEYEKGKSLTLKIMIQRKDKDTFKTVMDSEVIFKNIKF